jgi:PHD/YefM family antitoxin component YafN of YafNO toxin-antitoxin module
MIIERGKGKEPVVISPGDYNSLMETVNLLLSKANADRLYESIRQINEGATTRPAF